MVDPAYFETVTANKDEPPLTLYCRIQPKLSKQLSKTVEPRYHDDMGRLTAARAMRIIMGWVKLSGITGKSKDNIVLQWRAFHNQGKERGRYDGTKPRSRAFHKK